LKKRVTPVQKDKLSAAVAFGITSSELLYVYDVVSEWRSLTELRQCWLSGQ